MDHHYHHQWRQVPPQPNQCPTCSVPHFPFCPPHPSYAPQNPNYPPHPPHFPQPGFDPYHAPPPVAPHYRPYMGDPSDGFSDPRSWNRNPNFGYDYGGGNGYVALGGDVDRSYKRPRVDEIGSGSGLTQNPVGVSSDDERRLKLIRDHGGASLAGFNNETNRYPQNNAATMAPWNEFHPDAKDFDQASFHKPVYNAANQQQNFPGYGSHQIQSKDSVLGNEIQYSQVNNWQGYEQSSNNHYNNRQQLPPPPPPPPYGMQNRNYMPQNGYQNVNQRDYPHHPSGNNTIQPPLPASSPPPLPGEPPLHLTPEFKAYPSPSKASFSLFPVPVSSSTTVHSSYPPVSEANPLSQQYYRNKPVPSTVYITEESHAIHRIPSGKYTGEGRSFPSKNFSSDKPKFIDASQLFKDPHRATRPDHIVIILRGLPGSGKSYVAKMLRDLEVENGGAAPRIHSMDDYFVTEVEKVEEIDVSKSSSSGRSKKQVTKKVMEYCYEAEMEEAYRQSMLKAFKRTLEDGIFKFVIVDDRNLRVADFAQFWAVGKRSGYEVYILEATYKDPAGCAARNVHGFTLDDIQEMAGQWEEAPAMYLQLEIKSLFHGDDLKESGIQEVDMDMEDGDVDVDEGTRQWEGKPEETEGPSVGDDVTEDSSKDGTRYDAEGEHPAEVKELSRSKWSNDLDKDDTEGSAGGEGKANALSGLIQAYIKEGKSVQWGDQDRHTGFSIAAAKKAKTSSLVIGPGAGYNLKSNPLSKEESPQSTSMGNTKKQSVFQEQLRAERESFKAVFDRRRQRIGGLDLDED